MITEQLQAKKSDIDKTYKQLSDDSGIAITTLHDFFSGKSETTLIKAEQIAQALGYKMVLKKIK